MKLHEILADPILSAEVKNRACTGHALDIGPAIKFRPVSEKWDRKQTQNPEPGVQKREQKAPLKGENGKGA